jgi:hypothetical protein
VEWIPRLLKRLQIQAHIKCNSELLFSLHTTQSSEKPHFATLSIKVGKSNEKIQKKQYRKFCGTATRKYYETESHRL